METGFIKHYCSRFAELIGCASSAEQDATDIGVTRMAELPAFVDELMEAWTRRMDREQEVTAVLPRLSHQALLHHRFCTYSEYIQLHKPVRSPDGWETPVFRLLNITDARKQHEHQKRFPQSREGYFALMEVLQPQMRTFFFQRVQSRNSA